MDDTLSVTIIQADLAWEDAAANRHLFSEKISKILEGTDLIILPEMFTTGFSMNAEKLSEKTDGTTLGWMISEAKKYRTAITGSIIVNENGNFYNRLYFVKPDGIFEHYDKKHTFTLAGEHKIYASGNKRILVEYKGWKICPLICYDLRFPVWARNTDAYDVLIYVANWPDKRVNAWDALLKARAIENMSYCIGLNRTGFDGNDHKYTGHSAIYDVLGNQISNTDFEAEFTQTIILEKSHIFQNREHLQFLKDRDNFNLI